MVSDLYKRKEFIIFIKNTENKGKSSKFIPKNKNN